MITPRNVELSNLPLGVIAYTIHKIHENVLTLLNVWSNVY